MESFELEKSVLFVKSDLGTFKNLEKEHNTLRAEIQSLREELQTLEKKFHQGNKDKNFKYSNTKTYL